MKFTSSNKQHSSFDTNSKILKLKPREAHSNRTPTWHEASIKKGDQMIQVSVWSIGSEKESTWEWLFLAHAECTWLMNFSYPSVCFPISLHANFADFMSFPKLQHYQRSSFNCLECFPYFALTASVGLRTQQRSLGDVAYTKSSSYSDAGDDLSRVCSSRLKC